MPTAQGGYWGVGDRSFANGAVSGYAGQLASSKVSIGSEVIRGESRIEYVPFEKKIVEYRV